MVVIMAGKEDITNNLVLYNGLTVLIRTASGRTGKVVHNENMNIHVIGTQIAPKSTI